MKSIRSFSRRHAGLFLASALGAGVACSSPDVSGPPSVDLAQLPWTLSLNTHAILMDTTAPYNTLQLTAVPRTIDGAILGNAPAPTFTSSDSSVRVSSTGLLTARLPRNGAKIIATLLIRGVLVADTAIVNVTGLSAPPTFQHLQLQLQSGENAQISVPTLLETNFYARQDHLKTLLISAQDAGTSQIANSIVALRVSDELQAGLNVDPLCSLNTVEGTRAISSGATITVCARQAARVAVPFTVHASATVYGVTLEDSLQLMLVNPMVVVYTLLHKTSNNSVFLQPQSQLTTQAGGWVWWVNAADATDSLDVVFDDPTSASPDMAGFFGFLNSGGGNIAPFSGGGPDWSNGLGNPFVFVQSRQFLLPGSYHWTSPQAGVSGTVIVQ